MTLIDTKRLCEIAEVEYADIVVEALVPGVNQVRIILRDGSFVDVWFSLKLSDRFSFHWERRAIDGTLYRHDNAPHKRWQSVATFPNHFHDGSEEGVSESRISRLPEEALRQFLAFARERLRQSPQDS